MCYDDYMLSLLIFITSISINLVLLLFIIYKKGREFNQSLFVFVCGLVLMLIWTAANYFADTTPHDTALIWGIPIIYTMARSSTRDCRGTE